MIAADYKEIKFPTSFDGYELEVLAAVPERLIAQQKVAVPYRITRG